MTTVSPVVSPWAAPVVTTVGLAAVFPVIDPRAVP